MIRSGNAIKELDYKGEYRGVYPIKVNQQQQVIEEMTKFGQKYHHGLEVGSKAELVSRPFSDKRYKKPALSATDIKTKSLSTLGFML